MKAVIYLRTSTKKQAEQNVGYKDQLDHCFSVAKNYGCERTLVFIDSAVSGIKDIRERLELQHAIDALDPGDLFIIKNVSRLARNENLFSELERVINTRGARLISALELECNQNNYEGKAARFIAAVRAEFDRELCINKTNKNIKKKKKQGLRIGNVQYGFQLANDTFALEPNNEEQKIITTVKELSFFYQDTKVIANEINMRGFRSRTGKIFQPIQIDNIMKKNDLKKKEHQPEKKLRELPYGYQYNPKTLEPELNLFEQKIIKHVRFLRAEKFSLSEIAIQLQAMSYRNRKGGRFYKSQVAKMLIERDQQGNRINYNLKKKNQIKSKQKIKREAAQKIAQQLRREGCSYSVIAKELNQRKFKNSKNHRFTKNNVSYLLQGIPVGELTVTSGKSNLPYGFKYVGATLKREPCENEQAVINLIMNLHNLGCGKKEISVVLNKKNLRDRKGSNFRTNQIDRIITKRENQNNNSLTEVGQ